MSNNAKEQETLKATVLKLYSAGAKVADIVIKPEYHEARYII
jgi:hypothetical protein